MNGNLIHGAESVARFRPMHLSFYVLNPAFHANLMRHQSALLDLRCAMSTPDYACFFPQHSIYQPNPIAKNNK